MFFKIQIKGRWIKLSVKQEEFLEERFEIWNGEWCKYFRLNVIYCEEVTDIFSRVNRQSRQNNIEGYSQKLVKTI